MKSFLCRKIEFVGLAKTIERQASIPRSVQRGPLAQCSFVAFTGNYLIYGSSFRAFSTGQSCYYNISTGTNHELQNRLKIGPIQMKNLPQIYIPFVVDRIPNNMTNKFLGRFNQFLGENRQRKR
jgi:hypothetical protein